MRILLINYMETTAPGGINKVVREIAKNLSNRHEITVLQPNPLNLPEREIYEGFEIIRINSKISNYLYGFSPKAYFYLKKHLKELNPDIIHIHGYHTLFSSGIIRTIRVVEPTVPIIFSPHFGIHSHSSVFGKLFWSPYNKLIGQRTIRASDLIIVSSEFEKTTFQQEFLMTVENRINVIPHGVEKIEMGQRDKKKRDAINLLYGGYLLKIKGIQHIVLALKELVEKYNVKNVNFKIIGDGPYKKTLIEMIKKLNLEMFTEFEPFLDHPTFLKQIKSADIFLYLSEAENYGITVAESLALGTPVIVTKRTALNEFLNEPGCFGIDYPPDPKEVAELILKIVNSDVKVGPFSKKIRNWDEIVEDYEKIYKKVLKDTKNKNSRNYINILASSPFCGVSYPKSGAQNRLSNLLKELRKQGNKIIILEPKKFFHKHDQKLGKVYTYNEKIFGMNLPTVRDFNPSFIFTLMKVINEEDINLLQLSHPSGIITAKLLTKIIGKKIPVIYDANNVESDFVIDIIANSSEFTGIRKKILPAYIYYLEKFACKYFADHILCVSYKDRKEFIEKYRLDDEKLSVIPSGCPLPELSNKEMKKILKEEIGINPDQIVIFFHGSFSHPPNKEAFKLIENYLAPKFIENDKVIFLIGGEGAPQFTQNNIKSLGYIKNLYRTMSVADIAIVPLRKGGGTKLKVLDYLAMGLPIVTTEKGGEGIDIEKNKHAIIVEDINKKFVEAINYLVENPDERKRIGKNARKLAEEKYEWGKIGEKLDALYKDIIRGIT